MSIRRSSALLITGLAMTTSLVLPSAAVASPGATGHAAARTSHSVVTHVAKHPKKKHKKAKRTTPTPAEVQNAIKGLKNFVHSLFTPSPAQVATLGNDVCTAFDKGKSVKSIKATMLQKVKSLPFTTVLPGAAQYVVKTEVKLYCPGYKSKLKPKS
jgi:hypothetical protein